MKGNNNTTSLKKNEKRGLWNVGLIIFVFINVMLVVMILRLQRSCASPGDTNDDTDMQLASCKWKPQFVIIVTDGVHGSTWTVR